MMWNDGGLRARLASGGRQRIVEKINWRKAAEETLAVYEEIVPVKRRSFAVLEPGTGHQEPRLGTVLGG
jgi:hypothetical protein